MADDDGKMRFGVTDNPPWHITLFFSFQLLLTNVSACIVMASIISTTICADALFTSKLFTTTCLMSGVTTVIQVIFGSRLPIFQGPTLLGVLPYLDAKDDPAWRCNVNMTEYYMIREGNITGLNPNENAWDEQWSKIQGSMLIAAAFETFIGLSGLVGVMSRAIRPVSITVIFLLIGVYLWELGSILGEIHWGIAFGSLILVMIFAMYINTVKVPFPSWTRKKGLRWKRLQIFELFPILLTILVMWPVCHVVTVLGGFTDNSTLLEYKARTDIYSEDIRDAPSFRFPYPGQFGAITFDVKYIAFYIPCLLASAVESIADYHQYALACQAPSPPSHAINRGIAMEGFGAIISAVLGAGHPTTSYSNMMGIISLTKVASRRVMLVCALMMPIVGVIGPLGAALVAIPSPVLFGPMTLSIAFLVGSAFNNLVDVDLTRRRNLSILGVSVYVSCVLSFYLVKEPHAINTRSEVFNDVVTGIFKIPFITGGIISVFLDMTLAGDVMKEGKIHDGPSDEVSRIYDPPYIGPYMKRHRIFKYIPFLPGPCETNEGSEDTYNGVQNGKTVDTKL